MRARDTLRGLPPTKPPAAAADAPAPDPLSAYLVDAAQRTILYWDVMRRRGNQYLEHMAQKVPNVLHFGAELVMAGTSLERPVNYGLVRIVPPQGVTVDPKKRPFVVIDPRAGHGPGIGGFKPESQIGVALAAGHPCYFIGFLPQPVPGQTIEDVMEAEAAFLANEIISEIWVDRGANYSNVAKYAVSGGTTGGAPGADRWVQKVQTLLPGSDTYPPEVAIVTPAAGGRQVTVTLRWKAPEAVAPSNHVAIAFVSDP